MNIIFSSYDDISNPWYGGGGARAIYEIGKRLARGHTVTVITGRYPGSRNETVDGINYKRIGTHLVGPRFGQVVYQLLLPFYCWISKFDVWIESFTPPISTALLPLVTPKPVIGMAQLLGGRDMSKKYRIPFYLFERFGLQFYKHCIVLTPQEKYLLQLRHPAMKISVIPNGIEGWSRLRKETPSEPYMLFVGRYDIHQKGLDILLSAWSKLSIKKVKLILAGNGSKKEVEQLQTMIQNLNLSGAVVVRGPVAGAEKEQLYSNCLGVVLPSRFESFAITALEALAYGKKVVTFNIPGLEWIPVQFKEVAEAFNAESLCDCLGRVCTKKSSKKLTYEMVKFSQRFTWDKIAHQYEQQLV